jgi:diguanylate cyclase (GGDEF)-like protein
MVDVDYFKVYNDTYGHQQGDVALKFIANAISQSLKRSVDFAARWGGEEFIVLLPNTDLKGALDVAERIRKNIKDMVIPSPENMNASKMTVSIGINSLACINGNTTHEFISGADTALYAAKAKGRNLVCHFTTPPQEG